MTGAPRRDPHDQVCVPVERGVPDCGTGPMGRLRFVARELAAWWAHRRTTGGE